MKVKNEFDRTIDGHELTVIEEVRAMRREMGLADAPTAAPAVDRANQLDVARQMREQMREQMGLST